MNLLTEDQTVLLLLEYLKTQGYSIESYCLGSQRGFDIIAIKNGKKMIVEVKGAKASDDSPIKKREFFSSGQIKTHFGKAIVKSIETKLKFPNDFVAIAHPMNDSILNAISSLIPELKKLGISHFWVETNGNVISN